jgi:hypothetical protein
MLDWLIKNMTYAQYRHPQVEYTFKAIDPKDPMPKYQRIPVSVSYAPVYFIPFTPETCDFYYDRRANDAMGLNLRIEGSGTVYGITKYKQFRDTPFEQLWDLVSIPTTRMNEKENIVTAPVNITKAARERESKEMRDTIRAQESRNIT